MTTIDPAKLAEVSGGLKKPAPKPARRAKLPPRKPLCPENVTCYDDLGAYMNLE